MQAAMAAHEAWAMSTCPMDILLCTSNHGCFASCWCRTSCICQAAARSQVSRSASRSASGVHLMKGVPEWCCRDWHDQLSSMWFQMQFDACFQMYSSKAQTQSRMQDIPVEWDVTWCCAGGAPCGPVKLHCRAWLQMRDVP